MHRTLIIVALAASGLIAFTTTATAETITVCATGCHYTSINAAIDASSNGDVIELSAETYYEGKQIDTDGKAITLRGQLDTAGRPASLLNGSGNHRVLTCRTGETSATAFENLWIHNGYAQPEQLPGSLSLVGGGMLNSDNSSPTLTNCTFTENTANEGGGGMYNSGSRPTLVNCMFRSNSGNYGGGMYNFNAAPRLIDCTFVANTAVDGGGMVNFGSLPTLYSCNFADNSVDRSGGAMLNTNSIPYLTDCNLCGNTDYFGYNNFYGDAIDDRSSGNNLLEAGCVFGDINFDGDYDEDDVRAAMADFGITEGTPGDMDGDDDVDAADFVAVRDQIGVDALGCLVADINGDGEVNGADFAYVLGYWGVYTAP